MIVVVLLNPGHSMILRLFWNCTSVCLAQMQQVHLRFIFVWRGKLVEVKVKSGQRKFPKTGEVPASFKSNLTDSSAAVFVTGDGDKARGIRWFKAFCPTSLTSVQKRLRLYQAEKRMDLQTFGSL